LYPLCFYLCRDPLPCPDPQKKIESSRPGGREDFPHGPESLTFEGSPGIPYAKLTLLLWALDRQFPPRRPLTIRSQEVTRRSYDFTHSENPIPSRIRDCTKSQTLSSFPRPPQKSAPLRRGAVSHPRFSPNMKLSFLRKCPDFPSFLSIKYFPLPILVLPPPPLEDSLLQSWIRVAFPRKATRWPLKFSGSRPLRHVVLPFKDQCFFHRLSFWTPRFSFRRCFRRP